MKKLLASVVIVLCTAFGLSAPAAAQIYPPSLSVVVIISNGTVIVSVTGCVAGESVNIVVKAPDGGVLVSVPVPCTAGGGAGIMPMQTSGGTATITLDSPAAPGTYTATATGQTSRLSGETTFTPSAAQATAKAVAAGVGALHTDSDNTPTLWIGGSAILVGAGLTAVAWRRRRPTAA